MAEGVVIKHSVNRGDDSRNVRYRILAVMLSFVPVGTRFGSGRKNLDSRLVEVMKDESDDLISENFRISRYGHSPEIDELLSVNLDYGVLIGLRNFGSDFRYEVTERTHRIAEEIREMGLFSANQMEYLESLGKRLIPEAD